MKINPDIVRFTNSQNYGISSNVAKIKPTNFKQVIFDAINSVDETEKKAIAMNDQLALGNMENIHDMRIASMKADLTLNFAIAVQKKLIDAYKEIMRIQF